MKGFQKNQRKAKPDIETKEELDVVKKGVDKIDSGSSKNRDSITKLDPLEKASRNLTCPANDYLIDLLQQVAKQESIRTGYRISGRELHFKILKAKLEEMLN